MESTSDVFGITERKLPNHVSRLIDKSGIDRADIEEVRWYIEALTDGPATYRVEVTMLDGRELLGWVSADGRTGATIVESKTND